MSTKRSIKRSIFITLLIVVAMITTAYVSYAVNEDIGSPLKYHDVDKDINVSESAYPKLKATNLPAKYCSADYTYDATTKPTGWYPDYTRIKNQGNYGNCWAFATSNAADISMSQELGTPTSRTSPGHFAYNFYNRENGLFPYGFTSGDKNIDIDSKDKWNNIGGNNIFSFQAMANRTGMVTEDLAPYNRVEKANPGTPYAASLSTNLDTVAEDAIFLTPSACSSTDEYNRIVKEMIQEHGAVATSIYWASYYTKTNTDKTVSYYYSDGTGSNHAITLIGWDDNYSASNFYKEAPRDGAWILLNSWGESSGQRGLYYVSYADTSLLSGGFVAYNMKKYDPDEILFQYDGTAGCRDTDYVYYNGSGWRVHNKTIANVFTAPADKNHDYVLKDVGFTQWNKGDFTYSISVYKDLTDASKPESGTKVVDSQTKTIEYPGYHSVKLDTPVKIERGHTFSIVLSCNQDSVWGVEQKYDNGTWLRFDAQLEDGQSFYKNSSYWYDANYNRDLCYRIKGLTRKAYTVSFDANGYGENPESEIVEKDNKATQPSLASDETIELKGWYTDQECTDGSEWNFGEDEVTQDTTLFAKWEPKNKVVVNYKSENVKKGTVSLDREFYNVDNVKIVGSKAIPAECYHFEKWVDDDNNEYTDNPLIISAPKTGWEPYNYNFEARFQLNQYKVKFDSNGGSGSMEDQVLTCNIPTALSSNKYTRNGYDFAGWAKSNSATKADFSDGTSVENLSKTNGAIVTLYAVWKKSTIVASSVNFSGNYDGNAHTGTVTVTKPNTGYKIYYSTDDGVTYSTDKPSFTTAGTYSVKWKVTATDYDDVNGTFTVTINKINPTVTEPTAKSNLYYEGQAVQVANAGSATGGTISYAVNSSSYTAPSTGWTTDVTKATASAAGTYHLWYKVTGDDNHNDISAKHAFSVVVTNKKYTITYNKGDAKKMTDLSNTTKEYGKSVNLKNKPSTLTKDNTTEQNTLTVNIKKNDGTTSTLTPLSANQSITVKYEALGWSKAIGSTTMDYSFGGEYKDNADATLYPAWTETRTVSSTSKVTLPSATDIKRSGYTLLGFADSDEATTATYRAGSEYTPKADVTLYCVWSENLVNASSTDYEGEYDGNSHANNRVTVTTPTSGYTIKYGTEEGTYNSTTAPTCKDVGTYKVFWQVTADNYKTKTGSFTVKISPAPVSVTTAPTAKSGLEYEGESLTIINAGTVTGGTMEYGFGVNQSTGPSTWTDNPSELKANAPGTYYIWYRVIADSNHKNLDAKCLAIATVNSKKYSVKLDPQGGTIATGKDVTSHTYGVAVTLPTAVTKTGYEFEGWYEDNFLFDTKVEQISATEKGDKEYYAKWKPITYNVQFEKNGGSGNQMNNQTLTYGSDESLNANTYSKEGYTFAGWAKSDSGNVVYKDKDRQTFNLSSTKGDTVKLYAKWTPINYSVSFDKNGGTSGSMTSQTMTYDSSASLKSNNFSKTGYTFAGWARDNKSKNAEYTNNQSVSNLANTSGAVVILYAVWTPNTYYVQFDANTGTGSMNNQQLTYDAEETLNSNNFTKTNYTFAGWAKSANGNVVYSDADTAIFNLTSTAGGTAKLFAKWQEANKYTISYTSQNSTYGSVSKYSESVYADSLATEGCVAIPSAGYQFVAWIDSKGNIVEKDDTALVLNRPAEGWANATYKATFMAKKDTPYKVEYYKENLTDNSYSKVETVNKTGETGTAVTTTELIKSYTGYTYNSELSNQSATISGSGNTVLKIYYDANKYDVEFINNGHGVRPETQSIKYGGKVTQPSISQNGYTFDGWYSDSKFTDGSKWNFSDNTVTEDVTLYAKWTPIEYNITYNLNGGEVINPAKYTIESATFTLKNPTKEGYEFVGWVDKADRTETPILTVSISTGTMGDKEFTAVWTEADGIAYKIEKYYAQKGKYPSSTENIDTKYGVTGASVEADTTAIDGYAFDSETTGDAYKGTISPDGKLVLKVFFKEQFTVTYEPGEHGAFETKKYENLDYNVDMPSAPTTTAASHFIFDGWNTTVADKVVANVTYTAQWKRLVHNVTFVAENAIVADSFTTYEEGIEKALPTNVAKEGYEFDGWYLDESFTTYVSSISDTDDADLVLYAKFTKLQHRHVMEEHLANPATCTEDGNIAYYYCTDCKKYYKTDAGEDADEIAEGSWIINKLGHNLTKHTDRKAELLRNGSGHYECTRCHARGSTYTIQGWSKSYLKSLKVKKGKKSFTVKWKKQSKKNRKKFSGYQVQYGKTKSASNPIKKVKNSKSSVKIKGAKKTVYYVRVRTYYGSFPAAWSGWKSVKTK